MAVQFADTNKTKQINIVLADDHQVVRRCYTVCNPPVSHASVAAFITFL